MLRELLALVAPERESLDRVQVYIPHAGRAPTLFLLYKMHQGLCWAAQSGPARRGPASFFAAQDARGSLLDGATRTRAMWPHPIFYRMGCARVLVVLGTH